MMEGKRGETPWAGVNAFTFPLTSLHLLLRSPHGMAN
jgi:hypothetical protein